MSLGIVFKGPEGVVLAADSRVTLMAQVQGHSEVYPSTFDNATKLLRVENQSHVGVVTYGLGAIGNEQPRTAHSYLPEFEASIGKKSRLKVEDFAKRLSGFFMERWKDQKMPETVPDTESMVFLIGGYDEGEAYGRVYEVRIPTSPNPKEFQPNSFGPVWGGQLEFASRLINGYDPRLIHVVQKNLNFSPEQAEGLSKELVSLAVPIPYPFLPLQDCINLSILLIRTTIEMQSFYIGLRGVGGEIDVAVITKIGGFQAIKEKSVAKLFNQRSPV